jgi:hypothetical protein
MELEDEIGGWNVLCTLPPYSPSHDTIPKSLPFPSSNTFFQLSAKLVYLNQAFSRETRNECGNEILVAKIRRKRSKRLR